jgi:hypothetical protein
MGPHTILKDPPDLEKINGKPTGQGYGAARKGPDVKGTPHDVVTDESYEKGERLKDLICRSNQRNKEIF